MTSAEAETVALLRKLLESEREYAALLKHDRDEWRDIAQKAIQALDRALDRPFNR